MKPEPTPHDCTAYLDRLRRELGDTVTCSCGTRWTLRRWRLRMVVFRQTRDSRLDVDLLWVRNRRAERRARRAARKAARRAA